MYATLSACQAYVYTMLRAAENNPDSVTNHDCAALLYCVVDKHIEVALDGVQILGGNGPLSMVKISVTRFFKTKIWI